MVRCPNNAAKGRDSLRNNSISLVTALLTRSGFRLMAVFIIIPALSCCMPQARRMHMPVKSPAVYDSLDIFFFRDDALGRLDSYQRLGGSDSPVAASLRGRRKMALLANSSQDRYTWTSVNSFEGLKGITASIMDESPVRPVMSALADVDAGSAGTCEILLEPLISEIVLARINCDFTGKTYEGCNIEDPRVYLTNVNACCSPFADSYETLSSVVNCGGLDEEQMSRMHTPGMLYSDLPEPITTSISSPFLKFYCYPNQAPEESLGTPWTRLVIEGIIGGETWYWPLDINRRGGDGIARNTSYCIDVTIMRKGVKDPDVAVGGEIARVSLVAGEWKEMDNVTLDI